MDVIRVGDIVETAVYVGCNRVPTGIERVVRVNSGCCDVDHCHPNGNVWIYSEPTASLKKINIENL